MFARTSMIRMRRRRLERLAAIEPAVRGQTAQAQLEQDDGRNKRANGAHGIGEGEGSSPAV